jgi:hypothetical protein
MAGNVIPLRRSSQVELAKLYLRLLNAVLGERASAASEASASQPSSPDETSSSRRRRAQPERGACQLEP